MAHGYPGTAWLQTAMVYGAGFYTAKQQGIIGAGKFMTPFWKHHYFDWIRFFQRGVWAGAGGLVLGTIIWGNPSISLRRMKGKYYTYMGWGSSDYTKFNEYVMKYN